MLSSRKESGPGNTAEIVPSRWGRPGRNGTHSEPSEFEHVRAPHTSPWSGRFPSTVFDLGKSRCHLIWPDGRNHGSPTANPGNNGTRRYASRPPTPPAAGRRSRTDRFVRGRACQDLVHHFNSRPPYCRYCLRLWGRETTAQEGFLGRPPRNVRCDIRGRRLIIPL